MKLIEDIKNRIGRWQLAREAYQKKAGKLIPFDKMDEVGILYNAEGESNERIVQEYANELRANGKKVFLMGYVNEKNLPSNKKFVLNSEFFWREKLNSTNLPDKGKIGNFLEIEFDLLLNLYTEPLLPLQAMAVYSKAKYKAGAHIANSLKYSDTMIDVGTNQDLRFLIEQIDFYLKAIR
jgi:hypothetical protein